MNEYMKLIIILLTVLFVTTVLFFIKNKRRLYLVLITGFLLLCGTILLSFIGLTHYGSAFNYHAIKLNDEKPLDLIFDTQTSQYKDGDNRLEYIHIDKRSHTVAFNIIYLKSFGENYLAVFSPNIHKSLSDGLYTQSDYEFFSDKSDYLAIISKETGKINLVNAYKIIDYTINLDLAQSDGDKIFFPVYKPYSLDINFHLYLSTNATNPSLNLYNLSK